MYDVLLGLHLLSAAIAFITLAMFTAWAVGATPTRSSFAVADLAWNISGAGLIVFGVWLALDVDGYEIWDGWIVGALVLFGATAVFGGLARTQALATVGDGGGELSSRQTMTWHWLRTLSILAILVLMVWKPGA